MHKFIGKFEQLTEQTIHATQTGGFLAGDSVTIDINKLKRSDVSQGTKDIILQTIGDEKANLKISRIYSDKSEAVNGPIGATNVPGKMYADVYVSLAPGMWAHPMTVPVDVLQKIEKAHPNDVDVPYNKKLVRPNEKQDSDQQGEQKLRKSQTMGDDANRKNPTKNTKLAAPGAKTESFMANSSKDIGLLYERNVMRKSKTLV